MVRPVPLCGRVRARRSARRRSSCCLDQVTDPQNFGAVVRSAEGAGATGVVVPAHGSARVTPAVAKASAGAVEHLPIAVVPNLARYLAEVKGPDLWAYAAEAEGNAAALVDRPHGRRRARPRRGGQRRPAARAADVRRRHLDPARRPRRLAERECRRRGPPLRGCAPARCRVMADPTLYLFDGHNLLHAGSFSDARQLVDTLASYVAGRGARGVVVFDGGGEEQEVGPLAVRYADACGRRPRTAGRRESRLGARLPRLLGCGRQARVGPGGAEALVAHLPERTRAGGAP